jgi:hypothetical protein
MNRALLAGALLLGACAGPDAGRFREAFARGDGLSMRPEEERAFEEAAEALAVRREPGHAWRLELHLDRETVRRKRLPEPCLVAVAGALGRYPERPSSGEILWGALLDPAERAAVRAACFKALRAFHPEDLEARVAAAPRRPEDAWLGEFQAVLRR